MNSPRGTGYDAFHDPDHDAVRDLLGAYVLDAVDDGERAVVDAHLAECAVCRAEVREHLDTVAMLSSEPAPAPDALWDRIRAGLGPPAEASDLPVDLTARRDARSRRSDPTRRWQAVAAVAATIAVVLGVAAVAAVTSRRGLDDRIDRLEQALGGSVDEELLAAALLDPDAESVQLVGDDGALSATVVLFGDGAGVIAEQTLPPLPDGRTYQLWAISADRVVSAGVLGPRPHLAPFSAPVDAEVLAITEETSGGATAPTAEPLVQARLA